MNLNVSLNVNVNGNANKNENSNLNVNLNMTMNRNMNAHMNAKLTDSFSTGNLVINGSLLISGGIDCDSQSLALDSTMLISKDSIMNSFKLPMGLTGHCSVYMDNENIIIIGGNRSAKTFILNILTGSWKNGPELNEPRQFHACGTVLLGTKNVIFVTGGTTTEFLNLSDEKLTWQKGILSSKIQSTV